MDDKNYVITAVAMIVLSAFGLNLAGQVIQPEVIKLTENALVGLFGVAVGKSLPK